jgi:hypothetical protein
MLSKSMIDEDKSKNNQSLCKVSDMLRQIFDFKRIKVMFIRELI